VLKNLAPASKETWSVETLAYRALASISQGVLIASSDRRIFSANEAFLRITQYTLAEVLGHTCRMLQGEQTDPATVAAIRDALDAETQFTGEILNYRKNGEPFWNELTISPVHDSHGALTHFIGITRDVTSRKRAEAMQKASDERYRNLVENVPAAVVVHGRGSEILVANSSACGLLGLSLDQLKGRVAIDPRWRFLRENGDVMPLAEYPVNQVLQGRRAIKDVVLGVQRPELDEPVWVMCNGFPALSADGEVTEAVISFADVTVLKRAEQALQKSEERLRLVLQGTNDAHWDWDLPSDTIYHSPRWWEMVGYTVDELPPDSGLWRRLVHPQDKARALGVLQGALDSGAATYQVEFRMSHKAGHFVPVLSRGFILRDGAGKPLRISGTNSDLTERKQAEERIHRLAYYDALTDLPNRRRLKEQLRQALLNGARAGQHGALLFIDLDNFKVLNDTQGHDVGDQLLRQVAIRLRHLVRAADTVGRLGGDEFLVMLEDLGPVGTQAGVAAEMVAQKILCTLGETYILDGREHHGTPSIGIALFGPEPQGVDDVLKQADLAMYQAKAMGRNTLRFFDASMQAAVDERVTLERDLRGGLERGELFLHYQAQVDGEGAVIGAEVLVRWQHPQRGRVSPGEFIPMAEATGLILPLGQWVLRSACSRLARWSRLPALAQLTLAVNVSEQQFRQQDFVREVLDIVAETGAPAARLKLELTESLLAQDIDDIIAKMTILREHGIGFSLDDFGTGYSSLSYLKRLPLDQLKIDQSFVSEVLTSPNDATIARAIISLAENLGLAVIAEGVETAGQRAFLLENGCHHFQGYFFARPEDVAAFEGRLGH
jgi:diguanylate cyclase (GGDEF)-like protein/PAS domain S-box-containing protein